MFDILSTYAQELLGLDVEKLTAGYMVIRALMIYIIGIVIIRIDKRFIGGKTAFDTLVRFLIAAALANAITGSSPFTPTLIMVLVITLIQWLFAFLSFYSSTLENIIKGSSDVLYQNGTFQWNAMKRNLITKDDVLNEIRKNSGLITLADVEKVVYENSGEMSIIPYRRTFTNFAHSRTKASKK